MSNLHELSGFTTKQLTDILLVDIMDAMHHRVKRLENMERAMLDATFAANQSEERNIEVTLVSTLLNPIRGGYTRFPEDSNGDKKMVKVTFNGTKVSAVLDSMLGSARVYSGDLKTIGKKNGKTYMTAQPTEADLNAMKQGPWLFESTNKDRILSKFTIDDIVVNYNQSMHSSNASDPMYRFVTYTCNNMRFTLVHKLSAWEDL